ncbi:MAG: hypothetical protein H7259_01405, partial [Cytophagales bacterium]|nr:hypothetical protein [Cytophaga sp.]
NEDFIFTIFLSDHVVWQRIEHQTGLIIPLPDWDAKADKSFMMKVLDKISVKPDYDLKTVSFDRFAEVVCFANYLALIDPIRIETKYEVFDATAGIIEDTVGVSFYEIFLEKSFTRDFGVD